MEPSDVAGRLIWILLIAAWFAHRRWAGRAGQRQELHLCSRCGKNPVQASDGSTMCGRCDVLTQRNYRAGSWFFFGLAGLFCLMAPLVVVSEYRRFGTRTAALDLAIFLGMVAMTASAGWAIRHFGAKVR